LATNFWTFIFVHFGKVKILFIFRKHSFLYNKLKNLLKAKLPLKRSYLPNLYVLLLPAAVTYSKKMPHNLAAKFIELFRLSYSTQYSTSYSTQYSTQYSTSYSTSYSTQYSTRHHSCCLLLLL